MIIYIVEIFVVVMLLLDLLNLYKEHGELIKAYFREGSSFNENRRFSLFHILTILANSIVLVLIVCEMIGRIFYLMMTRVHIINTISEFFEVLLIRIPSSEHQNVRIARHYY